MLTAWLVMCVAPPKLVLVSRELLGMMRAGVPPWPEGGPCSDDLRAILVRQFDMWNLRGSGSRSFDCSPPRGLHRRGSNSSLGGGRSGSPEQERPRKEEGWADQLRALKRKVNSKQDLTADAKRERV